MRVPRGLPVLFAGLIVSAGATPAAAQEQAPVGLRAPPRAFALPMEVEHDFGAANGEATIIRFLPLWSVPLGEASQKWLVPIGGGPGVTFHVGEQRWATSLQAYVNAIKPEGAPDWAARGQVIAAIPH
jgi:hypothetical protein